MKRVLEARALGKTFVKKRSLKPRRKSRHFVSFTRRVNFQEMLMIKATLEMKLRLFLSALKFAELILKLVEENESFAWIL